jgi:rhamnogalacturonan hydrolase
MVGGQSCLKVLDGNTNLSLVVTSEADVATVSNITMRNIYVYQCTQMLMIKTWPGGSGAMGYVKDSVFENFWAYDTTYGLGNLPASLIVASI